MNRSRIEPSEVVLWRYAEHSAQGSTAFSGLPTLSRHNPQPATRYDVAVIGAGMAGTAAARRAAERGARVALVERAAAGESARSRALWTGLLEAAALVHSLRERLDGREPIIDFAGLMVGLCERPAHVGPDALACVDHPNIDIFTGPARFLDSDTLSVSGVRVKFNRALI
ncbi:MAG TPA: FAD-dependent oxidoreductase, partial [Polyangiaceae bacterium]|nr:FAD-dependent oxidoreductase [Polyangiaceae bacterium]